MTEANHSMKLAKTAALFLLTALSSAACGAVDSAGPENVGSESNDLKKVPAHCGGNIANPPKCPSGYACVPDPAHPNLPFGDVGGICQKKHAPVPDHCGGNIANAPECPAGYACVPDPAQPNLPFGDVGGICQKL
jgi:hypothetical protein